MNTGIGSGPGGRLNHEDLQRLYDGNFWQCLRPVAAEDIAGVPSFSQSFPRQMDRPLRDVWCHRLRKLVADKFGLPAWRPQYQQRGTCVGQGAKLAADDLMAIDYVARGVTYPGRAAVAGMYPGSRVEVAGQPGRWDGSTGSWVAKWMTTRGGILLLKDIGLPEDSRDPDEQYAVAWCASRDGVPAEHEAKAKTLVVGVASLAKTVEEVTVGLNAFGVLIQCSDLIATGRRDSRGFSPLRRSGGHCQLVDGCFDVQGRVARGFLQQNSWGDQWGSGGKCCDDMPAGSVAITDDELQAQLDQRDSYLVFGINGPADPDDQIIL